MNAGRDSDLRVELTCRALDDLASTIALIAENQPASAVKFSNNVRDQLLDLARFPRCGSPQNDRFGAIHEIRRLPVRGFSNWGIFYRIDAPTIRVLSIIHGAILRR